MLDLQKTCGHPPGGVCRTHCGPSKPRVGIQLTQGSEPTHAELLEAGGFYAQIWAQQQLEAELEAEDVA